MINFEELNETNLTTYLNKINIEPLKNFIKKSLEKYGSVTKLKKANKVADVVWQKFEHLGYVTEHVQQQFVDVTIAACLIYNLFFVEDDMSTLLKHRVKLAEISEECEMDERLTNLVYEIVESQLGEVHPVQKLKPAPNTPAYTFAEAVWQVNSYKARV